jgi:predicted nucleotidyltransferase
MDLEIRNTLDRFRRDLINIFENRLIDIVIYGSVIRGGFDSNTSDIDFLSIIHGELSLKDICDITELHKKYRKEDDWVSLLEGRYIGIKDYTCINGYYVGTSKKGWKVMTEIGYGDLESAMILDSYESLMKIDLVNKLLHFTREGIVKEIRNQINDFIENDLLSNDKKYTNYTVITACRSLYTYLENGFISKVDVIPWMKENHFEVDFNNPGMVLNKIKDMI